MNVKNKLECDDSSSKDKLESFADRLNDVIGRRSARSIAQMCGLSDGVMRKYLFGESTPNVERLVAIADALGVTVEWLATGRGPKSFSDQSYSYSDSITTESANDYSYINLYDAEVSMGTGAWNDDERVIYPLAFRKDWLLQQGINPQYCAAIVARGDSMEETIKDGATLLVNLNDNTIGRDGVYVIRFDGHLLAKRLQRSFDGSVIIKSDNPAYSQITVPKDQVTELHIVGRVVWHASVL